MKKSTIIIIGGAIVVGAAAYGVYKYLQTQKEHDMSLDATPASADTPDEKEPDISEFAKSKDENVSTIGERHTEAAHIMRESLETIFDEEHQAAAEEIDDTLESIDSKLDDLFK